MKPTIHPLPEVTVNDIDRAIKGVQKALTAFSENIFHESHLFSPMIIEGDVVALVNHLQRSEDLYQEQTGRSKKSS